ncbi:hypothetical protein C7296_05110 [Burkholderia thailandensis]|uniref:helix-turn-helix domain-containing protein n=1 Tax=Burkholderia thailandensis TaxID=57975 RepID=UPI00148E9A42|nr:LexA family transcriptional regulator [Burkholderia thailandensis]NOK40849.1 hypothetical protein [Burkholderia thailandensis]NOK46894.1 helix-turn-helix domain-containing protein [Burkholderia thailandensis]
MMVMFGDDEFQWRLMRRRTELAMTQLEVAEKAGIAARNVSLYENGHAKPRGETIRRLATVLNCDAGWLANGQSTANHNYLAKRYNVSSQIIPQLEHVAIEGWDDMPDKQPMHRLPCYAQKPERPSQSSDATLFAHFVAHTLSVFRATRYPSTAQEHADYPAGTVIVFDAGPCSGETLQHGNDLIFRPRGEPAATLMRRVVRAVGSTEITLASPDPKMPPILFDPLDITILGVVVCKMQTMRT